MVTAPPAATPPAYYNLYHQQPQPMQYQPQQPLVMVAPQPAIPMATTPTLPHPGQQLKPVAIKVVKVPNPEESREGDLSMFRQVRDRERLDFALSPGG